MHTIIIGDGLWRSALSSEAQYQTCKTHVGRHEIARLMGRGRRLGRGPLVEFLRLAAEATGRQNEQLTLLLLKEAPDDGSKETDENRGEADGAEFVEPFEEVARSSTVLTSAPLEIPWQRLQEAVATTLGTTVPISVEKIAQIRFLVVGTETEKRVATLAAMLRNVLGCAEVAVCSHLVGSGTSEAHYAALRHTLPSAGVRVLLDLEEAATYAGLDSESFASLDCRPCVIGPAQAREALDDERRRIVELLCMHWTRVDLRPLQGGYSGSLLFIAEGWKGEARTEPLVIKIDSFEQMRREIDGYHQVKDFLGKNVPTFGHPVTLGGSTGVGMELAAMEGHPETLQATFEGTEREEALECFLARTDKALALLGKRLHGNTAERTWVVPYRTLGVHAEVQVEYLRRNCKAIMGYLESEAAGLAAEFDPDEIETILRVVRSNEDGVESEVCLAHGDLNFENIISDEGGNIWFIDWTHCGAHPIELDYAKLENDVKFVMTKEFDVDDLPHLRAFEEHLLSHRIPADADSLPKSLKFAKWDLRYRKVLAAVRHIREACFSNKKDEEWIVYRIALLRYAMHTLSFDKRRDRGECDLPQLACALGSVEALVFDLVTDDYHLKIRAERPDVYPPRQRISIDEAPWAMDCPDYDPPYYVAPAVAGHARDKVAGGWADPEAFEEIRDERAEQAAKHRDEQDRPLNPHGRTGVAGRGLLGRWGANPAVGVVITGPSDGTSEIVILLGSTEGSHKLEIPKGFVLPNEDHDVAAVRVVEQDTRLRLDSSAAEVLVDGYAYDPRQTDHAWVELRALHSHRDEAPTADLMAGGEFEEVRWHPLSADTVNRVPSSQARLIRDVVVQLRKAGRMNDEAATTLLTKTG